MPQTTRTTIPPASPPPARDLGEVGAAAAGCLTCPFARHATQTVFGEGPVHAPLMMVGEQPGDAEDLAGHPFVGPAGRLLGEVLEEYGVPRAEVYVTNAVKHFKFEPRGKFRLHQKPNVSEIKACRPWLTKELELVKPRVVLALGATAAQSVFGRAMKLTAQRGEWFEGPGYRIMMTWHPSALLRAPDAETRARMRAELGHDVAKAHAVARADVTH